MKKVSVIVLTWNHKEELDMCLNSLKKQSYKNFEVIVVDNGSTDGCQELVRKKYKGFKLIENHKNLGFAEGNNVGIREAKGEYIVVLNNDIEADKDWLKEYVKEAEKHPETGSFTCKLLFYDRPDVINSIGHKIFWDGTCVDEGFDEKDKGQYGKVREVFGAPGGISFYRREALEEVKEGKDYYDSDFFLYSEDLDLGFRLQWRGWKCLYVPKAKLYHKHGSTCKTIPNITLYHYIQNKVYVMIKNYPLRLLIAYSPVILSRQVVSFFYYLVRFNKAAFKARFMIFWNLPKMLRKRWRIQRRRKVSFSRINGLLQKKSLFKALFG